MTQCSVEKTCVFRQVNGVDQYVPVSDVPFLYRGERKFTGRFTLGTEKAGPSGSHMRTICTPVGALVEQRV